MARIFQFQKASLKSWCCFFCGLHSQRKEPAFISGHNLSTLQHLLKLFVVFTTIVIIAYLCQAHLFQLLCIKVISLLIIAMSNNMRSYVFYSYVFIVT